MNSYASLCDDFGFNVYLASKVDLPNNRETLLTFFDSVRKQYPKMTDFERRDATEHVLEEERDSGSYRTVSVDGRRLGSGFVNPPSLDDAEEQHEKILEMAPYHLGIHALDTDALDVQYYFDLTFGGNHDEVVTEALAAEGPFDTLLRLPGSRMLNYQPSMMLALDESCQLQARLSVETRTSAYQVRTGNFSELPITVYFTIRQFWGRQPYKTYWDSYLNQKRILDELVTEHVIPQIITPLQRVIGAKS